MARPTKFTPETCAAVVSGIKQALPLGVAAQAAGISRETLHAWLTAAQAPDADPALVAFSDDVQRARFAAQQQIAEKWRSHFADDWKAAHRYLSTVYPEDWADQSKHTITVEGGTTNSVQITALTDAGLHQLAALLGQAGALPPGPEVIDAEAHELPPDP
jgi:uncharacterized protein YdbL (DUF1318 family)